MANRQISQSGSERTTLADTDWIELETAGGISAHAKLASLATYLRVALKAGLASGLATLNESGELDLPQIPKALREQWFHAWVKGPPAPGDMVLAVLPGMACLFALGFPGSRAVCTVPPTANAVFTISAGATVLGSLIFATGATVGVFSSALDHLVLAGDPLQITAPSTDTGIADVLITLRGVPST